MKTIGRRIEEIFREAGILNWIFFLINDENGSNVFFSFKQILFFLFFRQLQSGREF